MNSALMLSSGLVLMAGLAMAQQPAKKPPLKPAASQVMKTHDASAEFVSLDAKNSTLTIKDQNGKPQTVKLEPSALAEAKSFKAGDKLTLTYREDAKGMHQVVTHVKARKA